jgi:putative tricarboxylic transport membrane protein
LADLPTRIASAARNWVRKRDFYAGLLMVLVGLVAALKGPSYQLGTLMQMGPGLMPTALGIILIILGMIIAGSALATPEGEDEDILPEHPQWLGWALILAGPIAFIIFGRIGGLIPATFSCVFISSLGDRDATLKGSFLLAVVISAFSVLVFYYLLRVPMPLIDWRGL